MTPEDGQEGQTSLLEAAILAFKHWYRPRVHPFSEHDEGIPQGHRSKQIGKLILHSPNHRRTPEVSAAGSRRFVVFPFCHKLQVLGHGQDPRLPS